MPRKPLAVLLALGLVVALVSAAPLKPDSAKPAADPELAGKLVIVTMKDEKKSSSILGNVRIKRLGSREFLVGEFVDENDEATFEATYWLPLEQVDFLMECKDKEAIKKIYGAKKKAEDRE